MWLTMLLILHNYLVIVLVYTDTKNQFDKMTAVRQSFEREKHKQKQTFCENKNHSVNGLDYSDDIMKRIKSNIQVILLACWD